MLTENTKKYINHSLKSIYGQIKNLIKKIQQHNKVKQEIEKLIYSHLIYINYHDIINFPYIINYQEYEKKILKSKENSEMFKLKEKEFKKIKDFVQVNYDNLLLDTNINLNEENNNLDNIKLLKKKKGDMIFKNCYICKVKFNNKNIHKFYHNLCKNCGDYNYSYREMNFDWKKRIAIVTGGRVKIGFNIAIKLLSYNCIVLITTRFPKDALIRFQSHPDYEKWKNNLFIYPIDFRLIESTVKFIQYLEKNFTHIDILINNAAQTIRRKTEYYKYLLSIESQKLNDENIIIKNEKYQINNHNKNLISNELIDQSLIKQEENNMNLNKEIFPLSVIASQIKIIEEKKQPTKTIIDYNGQPYDFSQEKNSWQLEIDEISFTEFLEVQIINSWTPYYLNIKLKPLLTKSPFQDKYIVNVTSVEGIFHCFKKSTHPHTNMAKASLNMMTRTCGSYYKKNQIYMTSVDTGWISPMDDVGYIFKNENHFKEEFENLPLDELDGAMRVLHPIIEGIQNNKFLYGILLKDYKKSEW